MDKGAQRKGLVNIPPPLPLANTAPLLPPANTKAQLMCEGALHWASLKAEVARQLSASTHTCSCTWPVGA